MLCRPLLTTSMVLFLASSTFGVEPPLLQAGIIGLDTSHAIAFAKTLNVGPKKVEDKPLFAGVRVVAAYPQGSRDIPSSTQRVPEYTKQVREMGVKIVGSIDELIAEVDVVLLESNDGRVHLEQLKPVLAARKPVFIDKPLGGNLTEVVAILDLIRESEVPCFCSSSLRYGKSTQAVRGGSIGQVTYAETYSPASLESTHTDLYWYGVHGCESLFTVMGTGCVSVQRRTTDDGRVEVVGTWEGGRTGVFRESNDTDRKGYGGKAIGVLGESAIGTYEGYDVLLAEIVGMFRDGKSRVSPNEMLELYAFMEAADESKRQGGAPIALQTVIDKARSQLATSTR